MREDCPHYLAHSILRASTTGRGWILIELQHPDKRGWFGSRGTGRVAHFAFVATANHSVTTLDTRIIHRAAGRAIGIALDPLVLVRSRLIGTEVPCAWATAIAPTSATVAKMPVIFFI